MKDTFCLPVSKEVVLKLVSPYMAKELFELVDSNRDHLSKFLPWVPLTTEVRHTEGWLLAEQKKSLDMRCLQLSIWHYDCLAGMVCLHDIDYLNNKTSMGYWIATAYSGRGIISQSVRTLARYAFSQMNLHRLEIICTVDNERSRKVAERAGFRQEGILQESLRLGDKEYKDAVIYGLICDSVM
eukprot:Rmarinus@m.24638